MNVVAIVQARMSSTRLPGKVLLELGGLPMLSQQIRRLRRCRTIHNIVIATTTHDSDTPLVELALHERILSFRGSESDVLSRYIGAADAAEADAIVRVTADCPLLDPAVTDSVVNELVSHASECDYASNVGLFLPSAAEPDGRLVPLERSYPRGLDVEAFFRDTLLRMNRLAVSPAAREHVTHVARTERAASFLMRTVTDQQDNSDLRWTVDTPEDFQLVQALYEELNLGENDMPYTAIIDHVRRNPHLAQMNAHVQTFTG